VRYHYHPGSPNCRKTSALITHLDLEVEWRLVDLPKGEQQSPEYLALNPDGRVPALEVDGRILTESNAIMVYLAETAGSDLWPDDRWARMEVLRWMFWEHSHWMYATGTVFAQRLLKPMLGLGEPDAERVEDAVARFRRQAKVLDEHLTTRRFLLGEPLSIADLAVAAQLSYAGPSGLPMAPYPHINRWLEELDEIPAWRASAPRMQG
jgi:glutathione S-transferase